MSEQSAIRDLLPLIAAPGRYCAANESGAFMVVLANRIDCDPQGLLLIWLVLHAGAVKGFKTRIDTADFDSSVSLIMNVLIHTLAIANEAERAAVWKEKNIYPIGAQELWDLIGRQEKPNYEHLKTVVHLPRSSRIALSGAMFRHLAARSNPR